MSSKGGKVAGSDSYFEGKKREPESPSTVYSYLVELDFLPLFRETNTIFFIGGGYFAGEDVSCMSCFFMFVKVILTLCGSAAEGIRRGA